jgi:hypothetical protein
MPLIRAGRPLKRWRYVGLYGPSLMLCAAQVRIGPARQSFWAVWDGQRLRERTRILGRHAAVDVSPGRLAVHDADVAIELELDETAGVETICGNVWTRKQAGVAARGSVALRGARHEIDGLAVIDDTAGYHDRITRWRWSAGVGADARGNAIAWNLVEGINDPATGSERTIWTCGRPAEVGPVTFAEDLSSIEFSDGGRLRFTPTATRSRRENLLVVRSDYLQPFGEFAGTLPGGVELLGGHGVMERHEAHW